ncbi:PilZ domain-containing protein [Mesorhizobium huakuii]|uniref:PilZ domain-containing protein n=1 Tax=Mesorhizobium huakuii TaxID=28104 RepID=A0A7G6SSA5_9HYPH|nr:PilZ domain-containing protein [Mesorhizobium huakuii]QND57387.1 PilZ domain-containing protein [Mesorhizobium huakuii]
MSGNPDDSPIERRSHLRTAVLKDGAIITEDVNIACSVRNQHAHGAELRVEPGVVAPERFVLHVHADGVEYRAVVRWRRNERLGVQIY